MQNNEKVQEREVGFENGWKIEVENWMKSLIEK